MALTRFPQGSFRELFSIALPLMISSLSVMSMIFVDRLLLAHHSTEAMNAAVNATTLGWAFVFTWTVLASISEVFVAQYNGAGAKEKLGEPVWQMIWLSVFSIFFFVPMAYWGAPWIYGVESDTAIARDYLKWMMLFGPTFPFYGALCGFFVGRGKTLIITLLAFAANIMNAFLDWVLIFGWEDWIPAFGPTGAAIATSSSSLFQGLVLFYLFISPSNRNTFGTGNYALRLASFRQCFKIGFPGAFFAGIEIFAFAVYYWLMTMRGEDFITVAGICQSIIILFYFFAEGVSKAATAVCGNLIGAKKTDLISNVITAGLKMHVLFFLFMLGLFYFFADDVIRQFMPNASPETAARIVDILYLGLLAMIFYMFFEGIRLFYIGLLTSAGDTFFLSTAGTLTAWLLFVLPVYLIMIVAEGPLIAAPLLCVFYSFTACAIYFFRFQGGKWKNIHIIETSSESSASPA